jgi:hypothetical protein
MIAMAKAYADYLPQREIFSNEVLCMNGKIRPHRVAAMNMLTGICGDRLTYSWRDHENLYSQSEALLQTARDFPTFHSDGNDRPFERREFRASIGEWPLGIPEAESQGAFLHFVTESDYSSFVDRFTEKILKPIVMGRPFLVLGPPNILRRLRFFGFSTFSDVFDESYDQIDDPDERLQALRASLLSIISMEPKKVVEACYETCTFNNRFLRENLIGQAEQLLREQIAAHLLEDSICVNKSSALVSVVMPSYNQAEFIEQTIASVLGQSYSNVELLVADGGSTDETLTILSRMSQLDPRLSWVSEPDDGPAHAVNKALARARGTIIGWLNSDDLYLPGSVERAVTALLGANQPMMVYGNANYIDHDGHILMRYPTLPPSVGINALSNSCYICQPTVFLKRIAVKLLGPLDQSLKTSFDYDWWIRAFKIFEGRIGFIENLQAESRLHDGCITKKNRQEVAIEGLLTVLRHFGRVEPRWILSYLREDLSTQNEESCNDAWLSIQRLLSKHLSQNEMQQLEATLHQSNILL